LGQVLFTDENETIKLQAIQQLGKREDLIPKIFLEKALEDEKIEIRNNAKKILLKYNR
jgi:hypothetical protein